MNASQANQYIKKSSNLLKGILDSKISANRASVGGDYLQSSDILQGLNLSKISYPENHPFASQSKLDISKIETSKFYGENPLKSNFDFTENDLNLPPGYLDFMEQHSKKQKINEVKLKEKPFYVRNFTGYPLILHLKFNTLSANFYVPNLGTIGLPYPYHLNLQLISGTAEKLKDFHFWIFLVGTNHEYVKCIYRGSEVIGKLEGEIIWVPRGTTLGNKEDFMGNIIGMVNKKVQKDSSPKVQTGYE